MAFSFLSKIFGGRSSAPAPRQEELQSKETFQREKQELLDRIEKTVRVMTDRLEDTQTYLGRKFNIQDQLEILLGVQEGLPSYELQQKWQDGLDYIKEKNKQGLGYIIEAVLQRFCPVQEKRKPIDSILIDKGGPVAAEEPPASVPAPKPAVLLEKKAEEPEVEKPTDAVRKKPEGLERILKKCEKLVEISDQLYRRNEAFKKSPGCVYDGFFGKRNRLQFKIDLHNRMGDWTQEKIDEVEKDMNQLFHQYLKEFIPWYERDLCVTFGPKDAIPEDIEKSLKEIDVAGLPMATLNARFGTDSYSQYIELKQQILVFLKNQQWEDARILIRKIEDLLQGYIS